MKAFCYLILIVAFFMYYQQNPVFTIIIILIGLGTYFFLKSKGKRNKNIRSGFFSGRAPEYSENSNSLLTLLMFQQLLDSESRETPIRINNENSQRNKEIDKVREEVLELLDEGYARSKSNV